MNSEIEPNDTRITATGELALTEALAEQGYWLAKATGEIESDSDLDYWYFTAQAGDIISVRVDTPNAMAARGNPEQGLKLLDKLDAHFF